MRGEAPAAAVTAGLTVRGDRPVHQGSVTPMAPTPHVDDVTDDELEERGFNARGLGADYTVVVQPMFETLWDHEPWCTICDDHPDPPPSSR